jgi:pimeloyl-ACP methyl ester carboxylesterase
VATANLLRHLFEANAHATLDALYFRPWVFPALMTDEALRQDILALQELLEIDSLTDAERMIYPANRWMTDETFAVFVDAFAASGFDGALRFYSDWPKHTRALAGRGLVDARQFRIRQPAASAFGILDDKLASNAQRQSIALFDNADMPRPAQFMSGHFVQQQDPHLVTASILRFVQRHLH